MLDLELSLIVEVCGKRGVRNCNTIESSLFSLVRPFIACYLRATALSKLSTGRSPSCISEFKFSASFLVANTDKNTIGYSSDKF